MTDQQQTMIQAPERCPICGNPALIGQTLDNAWYAMCSQDKCIRIDCYWPSKDEAIVAWNRRTSPMQSSGVIYAIEQCAECLGTGAPSVEEEQAGRSCCGVCGGSGNKPGAEPRTTTDSLTADAVAVREALQLAVNHIEHMAHWIGGTNCGDIKGIYSFEALGEDMPGIKSALVGAEGSR